MVGTEVYFGAEGLEHVQQPVDTNLCFAAITGSVLGSNDVEAINRELQVAGVSEDDGSTTPPWDRLEVTGEDWKMVIDPIQSPMEGAGDAEGVIGLISDRLVQEQPVALLYNRNGASTNPDEAKPHWLMLVGYSELARLDVIPHEAEGKGVLVMDPLADDLEVVDELTVAQWIKHSMDTIGVFAYALLDEEGVYQQDLTKKIDRIVEVGWSSGGELDPDTDQINFTFDLEKRAEPWAEEEVLETLAVTDEEGNFLPGHEVEVNPEDSGLIVVRYNGPAGEAFDKLLDGMVTLGSRPPAETYS